MIPDTWRAQYGQDQNDRSKFRPNTTTPIHFKPGKEPKLPYTEFRQRIEDEELEISKLHCPVHNIKTGSIEEFANDKKIMGFDNKAIPTGSLFTLNLDDDDSDDDDGDYDE